MLPKHFLWQRKPKSFQITGKITEVNLKNLTITIELKTRESLKIKVNKDTVITKAGKNITLSAFKKGDSATITYEIRWRKKIAKSISIQEQTPTPKKPAATKKKK